MNKIYNSKLKKYSQKLRREMTKEEKHLWYDYFKKLPVTVNRQKIIGNYIVDFYCATAKLVVEIDGSQHFTDDGITGDKVRDQYLENLGLKVVRYSNKDIHQNFNAVCEELNNIIGA